MSKFKIEFTLKQHTPIIHFQADQIGATLRATELKPKFDKFLKKYVFNGNIQKYQQFLIKDTNAFDYKVTIEQNLEKSTAINPRESLFFGNIGDNEIKKYKHSSKNFKIVIFSYNNKLLEVIKNSFEPFLANTNFGTRESKGYGCFYIYNKDFNKTLIPFKVYSFTSKNWEKDIKLLYSFLRQGINLPNRNKNGTRFYSKPAIFSYAKSKGWTWDKKAIKQQYFKNKLSKQSGEAVEYQSDKQYLIRDLLGLSSEQSWLSYGVTISKEHKDIDRFRSPITFKVIDNTVYFWVNDDYKNILNQELRILLNKRGNFKLSTPKEFDFDEFFKFAFNIDLSKHIELQYHKQPEYAKLHKILNDIKATI